MMMEDRLFPILKKLELGSRKFIYAGSGPRTTIEELFSFVDFQRHICEDSNAEANSVQISTRQKV
ncbi:hypothetical protein COM54_15535 [Bacillus toyonensis]|nr:hypothetical protein COM54_15535 [Bacillus toyonensis]